MSKLYRCPVCLREFSETDARCSHDSTLILVTEVGPARPSAPTEPLVGTLVDGKYRLDALIGRGGMGAVYRGTHVQLDRLVAVKVMLDTAFAVAGGFERFQREARAIARLKHRNIVTIYDFGGAPALGAYLVMEYLEGRTLGSLLRTNGPLMASFAVGVVRQVGSAVAAAHDAGILHRDLKTENIFLEGEPPDPNSVKVLDFGIAKLLDAEGRGGDGLLTEEGAVIGTPGYMSPEQAAGGPVDVRSDVYSLGCILYETLTGRLPFVASTVPALLQLHLREKPVPPSGHVPTVPPELDAVVMRALSVWPDDRFQSARDLDAALAACGLAEIRSGRTLPLHRIPGVESVVDPHAAETVVAPGSATAPIERDSIAVLASAADPTDAAAELLAEGIAEQLVAGLTLLEGMRVARADAFDAAAGPVEAGLVHGVRGVLAAKLTLDGERAALEAELHDVESGWPLWAVRATRPVAEMRSLKDEVLRDVVEKLRARLAGAG